MPTALHLTARFLNLRYVGSNAHPFHFEGQDRMLDLNVCQPRPPNAGGMHSISITESTEDGPNGVEVPIVFECATCNRLSELFRNNNPAFHEALAAIK